MLTAFFERRGSEIDQEVAAGLATLLELEDGDLWDLVAGRAEPGAAMNRSARLVLDELRSHPAGPERAIGTCRNPEKAKTHQGQS